MYRPLKDIDIDCYFDECRLFEETGVLTDDSRLDQLQRNMFPELNKQPRSLYLLFIIHEIHREAYIRLYLLTDS